MPSQDAYFTAQGNDADISAGQITGSMAVNFAGKVEGGNFSQFTIGTWVRVASFPNFAIGPTIFWSPGLFRFGINPQGFLTAGFLAYAQGGDVTASIAIQDSNWHYLAVTFSPNATGDAGTLGLFLDGLPVGTSNIQVASNLEGYAIPTVGEGLPSPCVATLQFATFSIWNASLALDIMFIPELGPPVGGDDGVSSLVAAFDFASPVARDISGQNVAIKVARGPIFVPRLTFGANGRIVFDQNGQANLPIGGPAPFTVMGWVYSPPLASDAATRWIYTSPGVGDYTSFFASAIYQGTLVIGRKGLPLLEVVKVPADTYLHIAITYDGVRFAMYVNAQLVFSQAAALSAFQQIAHPYTLADARGSAPFPGNMQGLSFWNVSLAQADIQNDWQGLDPWGATGLTALFDFEVDVGDAVRGLVPATSNVLIADSLINTQINAALGRSDSGLSSELPSEVESALRDCNAQFETAFKNANLAQPSLPPEAASIVMLPEASPGPLLFTAQRFKKHATALGLDRAALRSESLSGDETQLLAEFEPFLAGIPSEPAALLRREFLTNLRVGKHLEACGSRAGQFEFRVEDNVSVLYFHDEQGAQLIRRYDRVLSVALTYWQTILLDLIVVIVAMFGIVTTAAQAANAIGPIQAFIDGLAEELGPFAGGSMGPLARVWGAIKAVIKFFWDKKALASFAKTLLKVITSSISKDFWSTTFAVMSLVAQLLAFYVSGGALVAVRIAQAGLAMRKLIADLENGPPTG